MKLTETFFLVDTTIKGKKRKQEGKVHMEVWVCAGLCVLRWGGESYLRHETTLLCPDGFTIWAWTLYLLI